MRNIFIRREKKISLLFVRSWVHIVFIVTLDFSWFFSHKIAFISSILCINNNIAVFKYSFIRLFGQCSRFLAFPSMRLKKLWFLFLFIPLHFHRFQFFFFFKTLQNASKRNNFRSFFLFSLMFYRFFSFVWTTFCLLYLWYSKINFFHMNVTIWNLLWTASPIKVFLGFLVEDSWRLELASDEIFFFYTWITSSARARDHQQNNLI